MKKFLIAAGSAMLLAMSWGGLSHAGDRIIYYSPAPAVVYSPYGPVVVPGRPHGHVAWKEYDRSFRYPKRHHYGYVTKDFRPYYHGYSSPHRSGAYYEPGFSLSIGIW